MITPWDKNTRVGWAPGVVIELRKRPHPDPRLVTGSGVPRPKIGPQYDEATNTLIDYGSLEEQRLTKLILAAISDLEEINEHLRPGEANDELVADWVAIRRIDVVISNLKTPRPRPEVLCERREP